MTKFIFDIFKQKIFFHKTIRKFLYDGGGEEDLLFMFNHFNSGDKKINIAIKFMLKLHYYTSTLRTVNLITIIIINEVFQFLIAFLNSLDQHFSTFFSSGDHFPIISTLETTFYVTLMSFY